MRKIRTLLPAALLVLGACTTSSVLLESRKYERLGDHNRAFLMLDKEREDRMSRGEVLDEAFEREYADARVRYLLDRGQQAVFDERERDALVDLAGVLAYVPNHSGALALRERALEKLAAHATAKGNEHLSNHELEEALTSYLEAEESIPGFPAAVEGIDKVHETVSQLTTRAQEQFLEAVRKLPEFRYLEVRWHSANALANDPTRKDADELKRRANREIALATFARGKECQADDRFGAALVEYRAAKRLDESLPGIDAAIEQMTHEVEASALVDKAAMQMRVGKYEEARKALGQAFELSKMARAAISEVMIESRKLEGQDAYEAARDLEILGKKREALAAFEAMSKNWPDGINDEKGRIDALHTDIEGAEKEWAVAEAAEAAGQLAEALDHYQSSERFYALYKNAKERIADLKAKIAASGTGAGSNGQ